MSNVLLDLTDTRVSITLCFDHPTPLTAQSFYDGVSRVFREHGALTLNCGPLQLVVDVIPRPPGFVPEENDC